MALLEVEQMDVYYGAIQALRRVSLSVEAGEAVALLGANGAGKSTTLRAISGVIAPRSGSVRLEDREIGGLPAHAVVGRGLAHLPEGRELFPSLSVVDNLKAGHWVHRKDRVEFSEMLERVFAYFPRLSERRRQPAGTLSGGEQQMLAIGRALMSSPKMLLVDELSLGLAPLVVAQLFEILKEVNRAGTAVVIVEQFVHMALSNTDRAYVLAKGEIVLEGTSKELGDSPELVASYLGEAAEPAPGVSP